MMLNACSYKLHTLKTGKQQVSYLYHTSQKNRIHGKYSTLQTSHDDNGRRTYYSLVQWAGPDMNPSHYWLLIGLH